MEDRTERLEVLLKAAYDLLKIIDECYVSDPLSERVFYDGEEKIGYCLLGDIAAELDL